MVGPEVVEAVAAQFEATHGTGMPLAERMILAMEAGQAKGGDRRWGNLQSAAIKIADPADPGRGGDHIALAIEVGEHAEPVGEMKRIYYTTARRLGYRAFSRDRGPGRRRAQAHAARAGVLAPVVDCVSRPAAVDQHRQDARTAEDRIRTQYDALMADARRQSPEYARAYALYDDEAIAAVDKFRADRKLDYAGNPAGLVDARLLDVLKAAYLGKKKP